MKNIVRLTALLALGLATGTMTGCASIVNGTNQPISVETTPVAGADCSLQNDKGKWFIHSTPGSVVIHRSYKDLMVACDKEGYQSSVRKIRSITKPMAIGNAVFGGVVGAGVDAVDGAAYDYPQVIQIPMYKQEQQKQQHKHHKKSKH